MYLKNALNTIIFFFEYVINNMVKSIFYLLLSLAVLCLISLTFNYIGLILNDKDLFTLVFTMLSRVCGFSLVFTAISL